MVCDDDSASFVSIRVIQACDPVCARKSDARFACGARPRGWRTPPELWARKEFAWKATNSQTWNESLSIDHYPLEFFTRGRRDSIERIARLPTVPLPRACVSLPCLPLLRWFSWLAARLPK